MFRKKNTAPKTVAEALAGFVTLKQDLINVIGLNVARRGEAYRRIADARAYAEKVKADESAAAVAADAEIKRADAAAAMITKLLGEEDAVAVPDTATIPVLDAVPAQA